jgi:YfiR/HmsC-like
MKDTFLIRVMLCLALLFSGRLAADYGDLEFKVKASYLYNFTKFVTWPQIKASTFNLCILGIDPFGANIDPIEKKSAFTLPIKVIRLDEAKFMSNPGLISDCHILYVRGISKQKTIFETFKTSPQKTGTLVVGEGETFAAEGGMIGFVYRNGKIKLQINLQSVRQSGLKISAKLLEIAELIKEGDHV